MPKHSNLNDFIYIYRVSTEGNLIYVSTVSRFGLGPKRAKEVVAERKAKGEEAFYTIGTLPREPAFY